MSAARRRSVGTGSRGAAVFEFAMILPVLTMLLFGLITAGLALDDKQQMTFAAREGARYAATVPASQTFSSGTWATNVRKIVVDRSSGTLSASDVCVSLVEGSPAKVVLPSSSYSTSGVPCIVGETFPITSTDNGRRVQVTAARGARIELVVFGHIDVRLDADATTRSESS